MSLNAQYKCFALLLISGLVAAAIPVESGEPSWDDGNLIANGRFESHETSELPDGWSIPGPRRVRQTWRVPLENEIEREARRWLAPDTTGGQ